MSVESHIQLPISIIKSFSHKELVTGDNGFKNKIDFVYTLSFGCFDVESIKTREYGSQFGYFTEDVEELLSNKYESPLGNTRKKIADFSWKKNKEITIAPDDYNILKNYLKMLFYRSKYFYNSYCLREIYLIILINHYLKMILLLSNYQKTNFFQLLEYINAMHRNV